MDSRYPIDVDVDYAKILHMIWDESRFDQVNAGAKPLVGRLSLLEPDVSASVELRHESVDVLFGHVVHLFSEAVIDDLEVLQVFIAIMETTLKKCLFALDVLNQDVGIH